MKTKFAILGMLFGLTNAFAVGGNELGNGGDVFYCPQAAGGARAIMVDIYEAQLSGRALDFGGANLSYQEKIKYALGKWTKVSPLRTAQYLEWLNAFEAESRFISGVTLPNISDEGIVVIPQKCEIQQIAIQLADADLGTTYKRYTINKDLWDLMDENNRAALVLHELIFREAIVAKNRVSMRVRHLNGIFLSNSTIPEYFEASKNLDGLFLEWEWAGVEKYLSRGSSFKEAKLTDTEVTFYNSVELNHAWLRTEFANLQTKKDDRFSGGNISRDYKEFQVMMSNRARISGTIRYKAEETPLGISLVLKEQKNEFIAEYFDSIGSSARTIRLSEINAKEIIYGPQQYSYSYNYLDYNAHATWSCTGISGIEKSAEENTISFTSANRNGECTLTLKSDYDSREKSFSWKSFHTLKMKDYIGQVSFEKALPQVLEFDGVENKTYFFKLNNQTAECTQNKNDTELYDCSGIPSQINCEVPVIDSNNAVLKWKSEPIQIKNTAQVRMKIAGTEESEALSLFLPKDQTVAYKNGFFVDTPKKLNQDQWYAFNFDNSGNCMAQSRVNK